MDIGAYEVQVAPATYTFSGTVRHVVNGALTGFAGVQMTAYRVSDKHVFTVSTGSNGTYSFSGLTGDTYYLGPTSSNLFYAYVPNSAHPKVPQPITLSSSQPGGGPFDFFARPQVSGTIFDSSSQLRLSGIVVRAVRSSDGTTYTSTGSDAQGRYSFGVDAGTYTLTAFKPNTQTQNNGYFRVEPNGFSNPITIPSTVPTKPIVYNFRAAGIIGNVVNSANQAQIGVPVGVYGTSDTSFSRPFLTVKTNRYGYYLFDGAAPGSYVVAPLPASAGGWTGSFNPRSRPVTLQSGQVYLQAFVYTPPPQAKAMEASNVTLSHAEAQGTQITLAFTGALDVATAGDTSRFSVEVNGQNVPVQGATLPESSTVVLSLRDPLKKGDAVAVSWRGLRDGKGVLVPDGASRNLAAQ